MSYSIEVNIRVINGVEDKGILVKSDKDITVTASNFASESSGDVFMLNALTSQSTDFIIISKSPDFTEATFSVISSEDDTRVTIYYNPGTGYVIRDEVTLNYLQTFSYTGSDDPTGFKVIANKPIGVESGSVCDWVGGIMWGDHMCISVPPVHTLGLEHYIVPLTLRNNPDAYTVRTVAAEDDTELMDLTSGTSLTTLNQGDHYDTGPLTVSPYAMALACSKPCLVAQYSFGRNYDLGTMDPFLLLINPIESFITRAIFTTVSYRLVDPTRPTFSNRLAIVTKDADTASLLLDGSSISSTWTPYNDGSGMMYTTVNLEDGEHTLLCTGASCGFHAWLHARHLWWYTAHGTDVGHRG